jgi:hypothetical protein
MKLIENILKKFGYVKEETIQNKNIIFDYYKPQIIKYKAEIRPSYEELVKIPSLMPDGLKNALIRQVKKKLYDELESKIEVKEIRDDRGLLITSELNVVA